MTRTNRIAVAFLAVLLIAAAWWPAPLDAAGEHSKAGLKRAMAMYAVARGMNAIISVAQGTQITGELAVVGGVLAMGQVLDPINDLVEQFSAVTLMAAVAFGLQILLIKIGAHWILSLVLTLAVLAWFTLWWRRRQAPHWLVQVLVALVLVRFAVPVSALASEAVYRGVMAGEYAESAKVIAGSETARIAAQNMQSDVPVAADGAEVGKRAWLPDWLDPKKLVDAVKRATGNVKAIVADMKINAEKTAEHMVRVTGVFLLQTLVLPLLFLWLLVALARNMVSGGIASSLLGDQRQR